MRENLTRSLLSSARDRSARAPLPIEIVAERRRHCGGAVASRPVELLHRPDEVLYRCEGTLLLPDALAVGRALEAGTNLLRSGPPVHVLCFPPCGEQRRKSLPCVHAVARAREALRPVLGDRTGRALDGAILLVSHRHLRKVRDGAVERCSARLRCRSVTLGALVEGAERDEELVARSLRTASAVDGHLVIDAAVDPRGALVRLAGLRRAARGRGQHRTVRSA